MQPAAYVPSTDFSAEEASNVGGRSTVRTAALDAELAALQETTDGLRENLAQIQRDDGALKDGVVEYHNLSETARAIIQGELTPRGSWLSGTSYVVNDVAQESSLSYICLVAHTSNVFATDLLAGYWVVNSTSAATVAAESAAEAQASAATALAHKNAAAASAAAAAASATAAQSAQTAGVVGFSTLALLNADLNYADKTVAYVLNDGANNAIYRKSGASGSGSWVVETRLEAVYSGVAVPATNPGSPAATSRVFYTANTPGTYANFGGAVVGNELATLRWTGAAWTKETVITYGTPNSIVGEVVKGAIYPFDNGNANQVVLKVQPGTVIEGRSGTKQVSIAVTAGSNLTIDRSTTHVGIDGASAGKLYCSLAGQLAVVFGSQNLPAGEWVVVGFCFAASTATGGGGAGAYFPWLPIIPSNHFFYSRATDLTLSPPQHRRTVSLKDFGAAGDGVTDDTQAFTLFHFLLRAWNSTTFAPNAPYWSAVASPFVMYAPSGTYLTDFFPAVVNTRIKVVGDGIGSTIIKKKTAGLLATNAAYAEFLTFYNCQVISFTTATAFCWKNVQMKWDAAQVTSSTYGFNPAPSAACDYELVDCDFDYASATMYAPVWLQNYRKTRVEGCNWNTAGTGTSSHNIRLQDAMPGHEYNVVVRRNTMKKGTTGIFFGSNRVLPVVGLLVEQNQVYEFSEEGISFDGFGNNTGLCPIIASGTITSVANDGNGRLVITPALKYHDGVTPNQTLAVSGRSDWTNFYFTFEEGTGTGIEGALVKVYSYDGGAGTLTLDSYTPAADVTTGASAFCGVQAGFFYGTVRSNTAEAGVGTLGAVAHSYATAFSLYLNVFGFKVHDNRAVGCANGVNVMGGLMLSTYRSLAWHNHVYDNDFINCNRIDPVPNSVGDSGVLRFATYGGTFKQYGNKCIHNNVVGGKTLVFTYQRDFECRDNMTTGITRVFRQFCAQALPTASAAWVGCRRELITEDGSGNPTDIHHYECKLVAGVYSWQQTA